MGKKKLSRTVHLGMRGLPGGYTVDRAIAARANTFNLRSQLLDLSSALKVYYNRPLATNGGPEMLEVVIQARELLEVFLANYADSPSLHEGR